MPPIRAERSGGRLQHTGRGLGKDSERSETHSSIGYYVAGLFMKLLEQVRTSFDSQLSKVMATIIASSTNCLASNAGQSELTVSESDPSSSTRTELAQRKAKTWNSCSCQAAAPGFPAALARRRSHLGRVVRRAGRQPLAWPPTRPADVALRQPPARRRAPLPGLSGKSSRECNSTRCVAITSRSARRSSAMRISYLSIFRERLSPADR